MNTNDKIRARTLAALKKSAAQLFTKHPQYRSMLFAVSQYWADEADDAVHYDIVVSERELPLWPHRCQGEGDSEDVPGEGCWNCASDIEFDGWWDDNGSSIAAFAGYCHELGSQEEPPSYNALPWAVARKTDDGVLEVEIVAWTQRPQNELYDEDEDDDDEDDDDEEHDELDEPTDEDHGIDVGPDPTWDDPRARELFDIVTASGDDGSRRVLADYLQERANPRGEYIALALHGGDVGAALRREQLLRHHKRRWMHPLTSVMPASSARFSRGFLVAGEVWAAEDRVATVRGALAWGTVEQLVVHTGSACVLDPAMRNLREVGPLPRAWLDTLVAEKASWAIESLAVELEAEVDSTLLASAVNLPKLRALAIRASEKDHLIAPLLHARWWSQLERLTVISLEPAFEAWFKRRAELRVPWLAVAVDHAEPVDAIGWEVAFGPDGACEVTQRGFTPEASLDALAELLPRIPADTIKLVRSRYYVPSAVDIDHLTTRSGTTKTITL